MPTYDKGTVVFCDLDGTLFDDRARLPLLPDNSLPPAEQDFSAYHMNLASDPLVTNVAEWIAAGPYPNWCYFLTSRPATLRNRTRYQIHKHLGKPRDCGINTIMHNPTDYHECGDYKCERIANFIRTKKFSFPRYSKIIVLDNTLSVHEKILKNLQPMDDKIELTLILVTMNETSPIANFYSIIPTG